eukprot:scaffold250_cov110-Isochrysis_galbana.AAC.16
MHRATPWSHGAFGGRGGEEAGRREREAGRRMDWPAIEVRTRLAVFSNRSPSLEAMCQMSPSMHAGVGCSHVLIATVAAGRAKTCALSRQGVPATRHIRRSGLLRRSTAASRESSRAAR